MDLTEEEDESYIDDLLKSLDGIEQCFVLDFVDEKPKPECLGQTIPSINLKKRPIDLPSVPSVLPNKVSIRDPRLLKIRQSSGLSPTSTSSLPLPDFSLKEVASKTETSNSKLPRLERSIPESQQTASHLSKYLKLNSSLNIKSKEETIGNIQKTLDNQSKCLVFSESSKKPGICDKVISRIDASEYMSFRLEDIPLPAEPVRRESELKCVQENHLSQNGLMPACVEKPKRPIVDVKTTTMGTHQRLPSVVLRDPRIRRMLQPQDSGKPTVSSKEPSVPNIRSESVPVNMFNSVNKLPDTNQPAGQNLDLAYRISLKSSKKEETKIPPFVQVPRRKFVRAGGSEILVAIFKYLPLKDRKNAKLVCKRWYDTCNMELFVKHQKFVTCGAYDVDPILQEFTICACPYLNLEFHGVRFFKPFPEHWEKLGPRIRSLAFIDCFLKEDTFSEIIEYCTEMEHLSLSFSDPGKTEAPSLKFTLPKLKVKRPKLVSLDIRIDPNGWFNNAFLSNLLDLFPNISKIGFTSHVLDSINYNIPRDIPDRYLWSEDLLTISPLLKFVLIRPDCLEKLKLDVTTKRPVTGPWQLISAHLKFPRLQEIKIEIDLKNLSHQPVIEFCLAQTELRSASYVFFGNDDLFINSLLLILLNNCPHLRHLDVTCNKILRVNDKLFERLMVAKLKSLSIESPRVLLPSSLITENVKLITNEHLRSLSLAPNLGGCSLLTVFRNLTSLELSGPTDELLQSIWKLQFNLVTLKLTGINKCSTNGFCGNPNDYTCFSIRNLQNLEYLILKGSDKEWETPGDVFSEFWFPNLKYLVIDIKLSTQLKVSLLRAMQDFTGLEAASITCVGIRRPIWLEVNRYWKKLRYLQIVDKKSQRFKAKQYCEYFQKSRNLRAFRHEFMDSTESYYYDVFDKKVKRKTSTVKFRIASETVGNEFLDWFWF